MRPPPGASFAAPATGYAEPMGSGIVAGAVAGAAGTTALNAATYLDMVVRGRPPSDTPERTVETIAEGTGLRIPGDAQTRSNRVAGLGPLTGVAAGVGMGIAYAVPRSLGWRPGLVQGSV